MKEIYFGTKKSSPLLKSALLALSASSAKLIPNLTLKLSYKVLTNPFSKRTYQINGLKVDEEFLVETIMGPVHCYFFKGEKETILINHGWGDTTKSFIPLIRFLKDSGYSVVCFDHIGHGQSHGNISHLFAFIHGLKGVIKELEKRNLPIKAIINHSMGGAAVLNLDQEFLEKIKVIVISSPIYFFEGMIQKITGMGISKRILDNLLEDASKTHGKNWSELPPLKHTHKLGKNFFYIHDTNDRFCSFEDAKNFALENNIEFKGTEGLGHHRILKDENVHKIILDKII